MKRWAVVSLAALLAIVAVIRFVGFRCRSSVQGRVCYAWFRPALLVLSDRTGHDYLWGDLDPVNPDLLPPRKIYVAFRRDRVIDDFVSVSYSAYGHVFAHEISQGHDGRIDLAVTFHGRALTKAELVDVQACRRWDNESIRVGGRRVVKQVCADPLARRQLAAAEARDVVSRLQIADDHDFVKDAMKWSKGEKLRTGLLYM